MTTLLKDVCIPCSLGTPPLTSEEITPLLQELHEDWQLDDAMHLKRHIKFKNFKTALDFVNEIGELSESQGHHPDIAFGWGYVDIELFTHKIKGLSRNDFILAAKMDAIL